MARTRQSRGLAGGRGLAEGDGGVLSGLSGWTGSGDHGFVWSEKGGGGGGGKRLFSAGLPGSVSDVAAAVSYSLVCTRSLLHR